MVFFSDWANVLSGSRNHLRSHLIHYLTFFNLPRPATATTTTTTTATA